MSMGPANRSAPELDASGDQLTKDNITRVIALLRECRSPLAALRLARKELGLLYQLRLAVEAYLSGRAHECCPFDYMRLVNVLALFYYRVGRLQSSRTILEQAIALPSADIAGSSQAHVNLLRLDLHEKSQGFCSTLLSLSKFLIGNHHYLQMSADHIEAPNMCGLSIYDAQLVVVSRLCVDYYLAVEDSKCHYRDLNQAIALSSIVSQSDIAHLLNIIGLALEQNLGLRQAFTLLDLALEAPHRYCSAEVFGGMAEKLFRSMMMTE